MRKQFHLNGSPRRTFGLALAGWLFGSATLSFHLFGLNPLSLAALGSGSAEATDRTGFQDLSALSAQGVAEDWARGYVDATIGQQVRLNGEMINFSDMVMVDRTFHPKARQLVTSVTTAISLHEEQDVWVVAWERDGVDNVTTGGADGTAYLVVVVADDSGKIENSAAGVRQPSEQARKSGAWPTFDELLGNAIREIASRPPECKPNRDQAPSGVMIELKC